MSQQDDDLRDERELTAYHEACHFVMCKLAKGGLPRRVTILRGPEGDGFCGGCPPWPEYAALVSLAGVFAEDFCNGLDDAGAQDDIKEAQQELEAVFGDAWEAAYDRYLGFVYRLLLYTGPRRAIVAVAEYLLDNPNLELEAVYPLDDLATVALGRRLNWLCQQVESFVKGGAS